MNKEKIRTIPKKNYFVLGVVIILSLLIIYYLYMWYEAYLDNKLNIPILDKYMEVINYNELDNYLLENANAIVYVSMLENEEIRDFEKKFKILFKTHALDRDILYMDITNEISNINLGNGNSYFSSSIIKNMPIIMVFDNGELMNVYDIKENNYNIDLVKIYINNINFLGEGNING